MLHQMWFKRGTPCVLMHVEKGSRLQSRLISKSRFETWPSNNLNTIFFFLVPQIKTKEIITKERVSASLITVEAKE